MEMMIIGQGKKEKGKIKQERRRVGYRREGGPRQDVRGEGLMGDTSVITSQRENNSYEGQKHLN